jgi:very-short-patch-repair endonuclease
MCDSLPTGGCREGFHKAKLKVTKKIIPYNPALKALARKLRKTMTDGELLLWNELKNDKLFGFDFDRQRFIDNYIVDFYCKDLMLAIEIDGMSHNYEEAYNKDELRQQKLESFGIQFLRFSELEMKTDMFNVMRTIETKIIELIKGGPAIKLPEGFDKGLLK